MLMTMVIRIITIMRLVNYFFMVTCWQFKTSSKLKKN